MRRRGIGLPRSGAAQSHGGAFGRRVIGSLRSRPANSSGGPMAQQIKRVGVLGAGLMGHGIAQVAAQAGYEVVLREVDEATLQKGIGKIEKQLARAVEKGKASQEDADAVRGR